MGDLMQVNAKPTDGTVNSEIGLINEWYNNYLIPKGYVTRKRIATKVLDLDDLSANPPIPLKDRRRSGGGWINGQKCERSKPTRVHYWRMCFRHYLLTAYGSGCRPVNCAGDTTNDRMSLIEV